MAMSNSFNHGSETDEATVRANAWVARFAPLVMDGGILTEAHLRERLRIVDELRSEASEVRRRLGGDEAHAALVRTVDRAMDQLGPIESELRMALGRLAPGDAAGRADLDLLDMKLAEREAREEMGLAQGPVIPERLEMDTSPGNIPAAIGLGIFGTGWTAFTAVHATFMIGGMAQAFGVLALGLLAFYAIFFAAGFGMLIGATNTAADESIELDGRKLTVWRTLGGWRRSKTYILDPLCEAEITTLPVEGTSTGNHKSFQPHVVLTDERGRPVHIATGTTAAQRQRVRDQINAYLKMKQ
jgi:hypothetical protein